MKCIIADDVYALMQHNGDIISMQLQTDMLENYGMQTNILGK